MRENDPCHERALIGAHFNGTISPAQERAMRDHMIGCEDCRAYYKRKLLLANLDPKGLDSRDRLARGLGIARRRHPRRPMALIAVAATVLVFMAIWHGRTVTSGKDGFVSRGEDGRGEATRLWIYRVPPGEQAVSAGDEMDATDELAFAYENTEGRKYLLVFGLDEHGNVYWYHPAWTEPSENPPATSVSTEPGIHELPEAVRHPIEGDRLRIFGIFTDRPLTVKQVEVAVRENGGVDVGDVVRFVHTLRVRH